MHQKEGNFSGESGLQLYYQAWLPDNPKAVIQIIHGFGEHSGRYLNVVNKLIPLGYALYAHDLRGHGKSGGIRTYVDNFDQYIEDAKNFHDLIRKEHPDLPIFLLGHSMGSFIAVHFVKKYEKLLKGLILSGTGTFPSGIVINTILRRIRGVVRFFSRFIPPIRLQLPLSNALSNDPEVSRIYASDPLVVKTITLQLGAELIYPVLQIKNIIGTFRLPILIQSGSEDLIVIGVKLIRKQLKMENHTVRIYKGLKHEVYNEVEKDRAVVLNELAEWLNKHL